MSRGSWIFIPGNDDYDETSANIVGLVILGILGLVILFLLTTTLPEIGVWLSKWQDYSFPKRQIAALYYFGLGLPLACAVDLLGFLWKLIRTDSLTAYPNLNLTLAIMAVVLVIGLVALLVWLVFRWLKKVAWICLISFLVGPWVFWGIWLIYRWFAAPSVQS